ncbi:hypothetical protein [Ligilactobacillus salivarius]|uniref:hypothetical protein n=1 Tax=Ligilactobacillus salivarius TaxID=1624 RepID=UPI0024BB6D33|nr:hypothetical protein [Ligilactobacillus salivarius]WHS05458.1 hypothetical protein O2U07_07630 [Ligilactobacillus salivarius]WHS08466.1 hypothetical protein O2U05_03140 [Ligilactobacillus salivarius]WHS09370.1 hypothetical protein O2U04_05980 [Ligilactobacillus salivarius]WHS13310.1 hypothetical protein O2U03_05180 [Ligilactobacillus salivarius]WHS21698.1 hypothetical protein O2U08_05335 [Ligilactobacillus salivarius]
MKNKSMPTREKRRYAIKKVAGKTTSVFVEGGVLFLVLLGAWYYVKKMDKLNRTKIIFLVKILLESLFLSRASPYGKPLTKIMILILCWQGKLS